MKIKTLLKQTSGEIPDELKSSIDSYIENIFTAAESSKADEASSLIFYDVQRKCPICGTMLSKSKEDSKLRCRKHPENARSEQTIAVERKALEFIYQLFIKERLLGIQCFTVDINSKTPLTKIYDYSLNDVTDPTKGGRILAGIFVDQMIKAGKPSNTIIETIPHVLSQRHVMRLKENVDIISAASSLASAFDAFKSGYYIGNETVLFRPITTNDIHDELLETEFEG